MKAPRVEGKGASATGIAAAYPEFGGALVLTLLVSDLCLELQARKARAAAGLSGARSSSSKISGSVLAGCCRSQPGAGALAMQGVSVVRSFSAGNYWRATSGDTYRPSAEW